MKRVDAPTYDEKTTPKFIWRNGDLVLWAEATIHVNSVGHASVSGVFEGIKAYQTTDGGALNLFRAREHMARFVESAKISWMPIDHDADQLVQACVDLLRGNGAAKDTYLRPWCFARGTVRQMMVPADQPTEVAIDSWAFESTLGQDRGCRAIVSSWRRGDDNQAPARVKAFSNYHNGRLALLEARRLGADTAIMLGPNGKIAEGPASCLAMIRHGRMITPPVTESILESVTRDTMIQLARQSLALEVVERPIDRTELYIADEVFFMGTAWEILPVLEIDGHQIGPGVMGEVANRLDHVYTATVRGDVAAPDGWLMAI